MISIFYLESVWATKTINTDIHRISALTVKCHAHHNTDTFTEIQTFLIGFALREAKLMGFSHPKASMFFEIGPKSGASHESDQSLASAPDRGEKFVAHRLTSV